MILNRKIIATILFAVVAGLLAAYAVRMVASFPRWVVDDSFILFRYAENLARTGAVNWNPGENPTEGYTSFSMILLIAAAMKFGVSPIVAAHVIGIAAFFAGAVLIVLILRGFNLGSVAAIALFLTAPFMYAHAWSGLETTLFCAAILFALYSFTHRRGRLFIVSLLVLSLTRPEGTLLSLILLAVYRPFSLKRSLWFLVPYAIYFIWRFAYYGQLLPNTYYAKSAATGIQKENLTMVRKFATTFLAMPALLALIFVSWEAVKKHALLVIGVLAFTLAVLYTYLTSTLVMTFSYRFLVPFYAIIAVSIGAIVGGTRLSLRSAAIVLVIIALWIVNNSKARHLKSYKEYCSTHYRMLEDEHIAVGRLIDELLPHDECIIVHTDAGSIPYYAKRKTIDFGALNDEFLAHQDSTSEADVDYFYSHNAGAVVFTSRNPKELKHGPQAANIASDPRFGNYTLVKKFNSNARRSYHEFLYVRNDLLDLFSSVVVEEQTAPTPAEETANQRRRGGTPSHRPGSVSDVSGTPGIHGSRIPRQDPQSPEELWARAQIETEPNNRIRMYRKIVDLFPKHEFAPEALFMIGFIYSEDIRNESLATATFRELIKRYPDNDMTTSARWMLENMHAPFPSIERLDAAGDSTARGAAIDSL